MVGSNRMIASASWKRKQHRTVRVFGVPPRKTIPVRFREYLLPMHLAPTDPQSDFAFGANPDGGQQTRKLFPDTLSNQAFLDASLDAANTAFCTEGKGENAPQVMKIAEADTLHTPATRWVYLFERRGKTRLIMELRTVGGTTAEIKLPGERVWKKRVASEIQLPETGAYSAFLSQVPVDTERIRELEANEDQLKRRCTFSEVILNKAENVLDVFLVDPIRLGAYLQHLHLLAIHKLLDLQAGKAAELFVARAALLKAAQLDERSRKAWIDVDQLILDLRELRQSRATCQNGVDRTCGRRNMWLGTPVFLETRRDYEFAETQKVELIGRIGSMLAGSFQSESGLSFVASSIERDPWFDAALKTPFKLAKGALRLTSALAEKEFQFLVEAAYARAKALSSSSAIDEIDSWLVARNAPTGTSQLLVRRRGSSTPIRVSREETGIRDLKDFLEQEQLRTFTRAEALKQQASNARTISTRTFVVLNAIEMCIAFREVMRNEEKDRVSRNWVYFSHTLFKYADSVVRMGGEAPVPLPGLLAAAALYFTGILDIIQSDDQDIISGVATALAGVSFGAAAALPATATAFALGPLGWALMGAALVFGGVILESRGKETDWERWVRDTPWGKDQEMTFHDSVEGRTTVAFPRSTRTDDWAQLLRRYIDLEYVFNLTLPDVFELPDRFRSGGYVACIDFGHLPPGAIIEVSLSVFGLKATEQSTAHSETTGVQIEPFLAQWCNPDGSELYYGDDPGPWVLREKPGGGHSIFVALESRQTRDLVRMINQRVSGSPLLQQKSGVGVFSYTVQLIVRGATASQRLRVPSRPVTFRCNIWSLFDRVSRVE